MERWLGHPVHPPLVKYDRQRAIEVDESGSTALAPTKTSLGD